MSFALNFQPEAEGDLDRSIEWYEEQRLGLGLQFLDDVEATKNRIIEHPYRRKVHSDLRRCNMKEFQHGVFYLIEDESKTVQVLAIFHNRQDPKEWEDRYEDWLNA